jgi:hypothetical protein
MTRTREFITARATIAKWEEILHTQFYSFGQAESSPLHRAEEYYVHTSLAPHVKHIFNVVDFNGLVSFERTNRSPKLKKWPTDSAAAGSPVYLDGKVTPALLNSYYDIRNNTGSKQVTQAVFETINQTYSPNDLTDFQNFFHLPIEAVAVDIGGHGNNGACSAKEGGINNCDEANLDVRSRDIFEC